MLTRRSFIAAAGLSATLGAAPGLFAASPGGPGDAVALAARIRRGEISASEAVEAAIARIERADPLLNFMVTKAYERARARARAGGLTGPFAGVPYLVKDLTDVAGLPTRSGSRSTADLPPAASQSPYVTALEEAGLVILGKSATPEYGASSATEPLAFGPTRNPWNRDRSPGGSSGGSAAAVAAGVLPFAHANDGGGSIRIPAANCGLVGLKPSRGRTISSGRSPARLALASDHCVSRSVRDSATLLAVTEDRSAEAAFPPIGLIEAPGRRRLRIGMVAVSQTDRPPATDVRDGLEAAAHLLAGLGHHVEPAAWPFPVPGFNDDFRTYWITATARIVRAYEERTGKVATAEAFEPAFLDMARSADTVPDAFEANLARLQAAARAYVQWFERYDVILSPVLNRPPAPVGYLDGRLSWAEMKDRMWDYVGYTPIQNVAGAPAISLPLHWSRDGLPIGLHFAAEPGGEKALLELAFELEQARPWHDRTAPLFVG
ncbi:amidase [Sphingosinicella sp. LHD-64]|uniref:amidase n=1 Tax=Sphingosinicella sp. LHD-64 TaxID=3072139 RepID=UPI00280E3A07|nr:amidase [Sphingosinicella sp. LHD-64]MDQ8758153.1 amidase [Sphingosinicella sp. LHD-64]